MELVHGTAVTASTDSLCVRGYLSHLHYMYNIVFWFNIAIHRKHSCTGLRPIVVMWIGDQTNLEKDLII